MHARLQHGGAGSGRFQAVCSQRTVANRLHAPLLPPLSCFPAGAIVVDGVAASELTHVVPPALAGAAFQRGLTAALRLAYAALPAAAVDAVVGAASSWAHGTADAVASRPALVAAAAAAASAA